MVTVAAYTVLPLLLLVPASSAASSSSQKATATLAYVLAGVALLAGFWSSQTQLRSELEPAKFQTNMLISLALNEICVLVGFVMGGMTSLVALLPFALASSAAQLLFVLPRVMSYWRQRG